MTDRITNTQKTANALLACVIAAPGANGHAADEIASERCAFE